MVGAAGVLFPCVLGAPGVLEVAGLPAQAGQRDALTLGLAAAPSAAGRLLLLPRMPGRPPSPPASATREPVCRDAPAPAAQHGSPRSPCSLGLCSGPGWVSCAPGPREEGSPSPRLLRRGCRGRESVRPPGTRDPGARWPSSALPCGLKFFISQLVAMPQWASVFPGGVPLFSSLRLQPLPCEWLR